MLFKPLSKLASVALTVVFIASCQGASKDEQRAVFQGTADIENKALSNAFCAFEDQPTCAGLIDKRAELNLLLSPHNRRVSVGQRERAASVLRQRLSEAASQIQQCRRMDVANALPIITGAKLNGQAITVYATKPLSATSACFLAPSEE